MPTNVKNKVFLKRVWEWYRNSFNAKLFTLLLLVSTILIVCYIKFPDKTDTLKYITTVIIAFSGVGSAIYLGRSLVERLKHDRIKNSFRFSKFFDDPELNGLKDKVKENYDKYHVSPKKLVNDVKEDKELLHQLKTVFGNFEDMSLAIQYGFVNEEVLYRSLDYLVRFYTNNFESYIEEVRKETGDEYIYHELTTLAKAWEEGEYLSNGKDIEVY